MSALTPNRITQIVNDLQKYGQNGFEEIHFNQEEEKLIPFTTKRPNWFYRVVRWLFGRGYNEVAVVQKVTNFLKENQSNIQLDQVDILKKCFTKKRKKNSDNDIINKQFNQLISKIDRLAKSKLVNVSNQEIEIKEQTPLLPSLELEEKLSDLDLKGNPSDSLNSIQKEFSAEELKEIKQAIDHKNKKLFTKLINKSNVNAILHVGGTVLHYLAKIGRLSNCINFLKQLDADFAYKDSWGNTPLMWAIANANNSIALKLLLHGGSNGINERDTYGHENSALHLTIAKGYTTVSAYGQLLSVSNEQLMKALVDQGADVNLPNASGNTPLHLALLRRDKGMITYLLAHGGRLDVKNNRGETPLDQLNKNYRQANDILDSTASPCLLLEEVIFDNEENLKEIQEYINNLS